MAFDCLEVGLDGVSGADTIASLLAICRMCEIGRLGVDNFRCDGGGVGSDFGGIIEPKA